MADFALGGGTIAASAGAVAASSDGTNITSAATADTKGAYTELIAATAFDAISITLFMGPNQATTADAYLVDIATGAAGSEQVIIANVTWERQNLISADRVRFDVAIPKGSRIAARCQSASLTSRTLNISAVLIGGSFSTSPAGYVVDTYGADTSDTGGVSVDPGGSGNTKGAWSEISAALTRSTRSIVVGFNGQDNSARAEANWLIDIGIGGAGSEVVVVPNLRQYVNASMDHFEYLNIELPVHLPAGARVAVRAQCSITDAADRLFDAIMHGIA